jgi:hypothetical protein
MSEDVNVDGLGDINENAGINELRTAVRDNRRALRYVNLAVGKQNENINMYMKGINETIMIIQAALFALSVASSFGIFGGEAPAAGAAAATSAISISARSIGWVSMANLYSPIDSTTTSETS